MQGAKILVDSLIKTLMRWWNWNAYPHLLCSPSLKTIMSLILLNLILAILESLRVS